MGVVYLGRAPDGRKVAVKVIHPQYAADQQFLDRFRSEVDAARQVPRFCTAAVLDADLDAQRPYLVTEFVDGPSLHAAVASDGPLAGSELDGVAVGVAAALTAIHDAGLVHRDLKPGNVLLSRAGPRVIDFGIARSVDASVYTATGQVLGTPGFMSPEQITGERVTPAADVFAWGGVVAFAASGQPPFGRDLAASLHRILNEAPDLDRLEDGLRGIVAAAMDKDPAKRPSASELLDDLVRQTGRVDASRSWTTTVLKQAGEVAPAPDTPEAARESTVRAPSPLPAPAPAPAPVPGPAPAPVPRPATAAPAAALPWGPAPAPEPAAAQRSPGTWPAQPATVPGSRRPVRVLLASALAFVLVAAVVAAVLLDPSGGGESPQDDPGPAGPDATATDAAGTPETTAAATGTTVEPSGDTAGGEGGEGGTGDDLSRSGGGVTSPTVPPAEEPELATPLQALQAVAPLDADCDEFEWEIAGELATLLCGGAGFDGLFYSIFEDFASMAGGFESSAQEFDVDDPYYQTTFEDCADGLPASGFWARGRFVCFFDRDGDARVLYTVDEYLLLIDGYSLEGTIADVDGAMQAVLAAIP